MTQLFEPPARSAGAIIAVRDDWPGADGEYGVVHGARLVDTGHRGLEPILPICDTLITPVPTDDSITCEICLIRLRPDPFTKAIQRVRHLVRSWLRHA